MQINLEKKYLDVRYTHSFLFKSCTVNFSVLFFSITPDPVLILTFYFYHYSVYLKSFQLFISFQCTNKNERNNKKQSKKKTESHQIINVAAFSSIFNLNNRIIVFLHCVDLKKKQN
jgi:hypothetical protein